MVCVGVPDVERHERKMANDKLLSVEDLAEGKHAPFFYCCFYINCVRGKDEGGTSFRVLAIYV
jgi:hypothetical protein